jgi:peptide/nickel transport system substrate-binding protein
LDTRLSNDTAVGTIALGLMHPLIELGPKLELIPLLAESWEAKPGAAEWVVTLRKGVHFSNGKEFNLHRTSRMTQMIPSI